VNALRCAFCHDDLDEKEGESVTCAGCRTVLHWDCRALLARCPTLGCADATRFEPGERRAVVRGSFRAALARLAERRPEVADDPFPMERHVDRVLGAPAALWRIFNESEEGTPRALHMDAPVVCGICRRRIRDVELDAWRCEACGTFAHRDCRSLLSVSCPTAGCTQVYFASPPEGEGRSKETFRRALDSLKKRKPRSE